MKPLRLMFIAGEVSGDARAAELITAVQALLQERGGPAAGCFGAGGARMREAGADLAVDMTQHAVIGHLDAARGYFRFRRLFRQLLDVAAGRRPDAVVLVDFSGFNLRFARAIKERAGEGWRPKVIYFISPQLWASRSGRAKWMERYVDLLLSIIPFEKGWYAQHAPRLKVEFVGHPLVERFQSAEGAARNAESSPTVVLLPGSRKKEIAAHLPVMLEALRRIRGKVPVHARLHLPNAELTALARTLAQGEEDVEIRAGNVEESLRCASLAITKSGTVTLECGLMRVPAVVIYITSAVLYYVGRRVVSVNHLAMPNLLAGETVYPELVQTAATPAAIAREGLDLLTNETRRREVLSKLDRAVAALGEPGASRRAAEALLRLTEADAK